MRVEGRSWPTTLERCEREKIIRRGRCEKNRRVPLVAWTRNEEKREYCDKEKEERKKRNAFPLRSFLPRSLMDAGEKKGRNSEGYTTRLTRMMVTRISTQKKTFRERIHLFLRSLTPELTKD